MAIQLRIEATRSRTERWLRRLIHFEVSSANQRSTRFSHALTYAAFFAMALAERFERYQPLVELLTADPSGCCVLWSGPAT